MEQTELFAKPPSLPAGLAYEPGFLSPAEEATLLEFVQALPLREAKYKQYTARRRIVSYGGRYDYGRNELLPAEAIPTFLYPLRERAAAWTGIAAHEFAHALVAEYRPGTQLGWHRDVPEFEAVVGISLGGACRMRLRPYPPRPGRSDEALSLDLEPRSAYALRGHARWRWQHAISPTKNLRYSITFRTLRRAENAVTHATPIESL